MDQRHEQKINMLISSGSIEWCLYYSGQPAQGQPFNVSQPQQVEVGMDISNHSVVGLGTQCQSPDNHQNNHPNTNMMEISNHSHVQLNQHQPLNGSNHQMMHPQQQPNS